MEHGEDSFDVESFLSTPTDEGFPMPPQSPPHLPLLPARHMNNTDADGELVRGYLDPAILCLRKDRSSTDFYYGPALVNDELPSMNPWELPGLVRNERGMTYKYYHTDHRDLAFYNSRTLPDLPTRSGRWEDETSEKGIRAGHNGFVGIKRTMKFHPSASMGDDALPLSGTKTNWIMNVHYSCNERNSFIQDGLVLCHVFEEASPDYNGTRKCLGCHPGACNGNYWDQAFGATSKASFNSTHPGSRPMHHHDTERRSDPTLSLNSYIAELGNFLLGDPDNSTDTGNSSATRDATTPASDHGHSKKRKRRSDVWDYFTKIFARDNEGGKLTFAVCNHCCKILSGSSKVGTTHLANHTCPCKFKPVATGRKAKDPKFLVRSEWF